MNLRFILTILILFILSSCSSKKNVLYVQDLENKIEFEYSDHLIQPNDILKINVFVENPETALAFSKSNTMQYNESREALIFKGQSVSSQGFIDYPQLGKVYVKDMSVFELQNLLKKKIIDLGLLTNPVVDVKILNLSFTVLGEVNAPGRYYFDESNFNFLQALGMAKDLTINGNRKEIKLIRNLNGLREVYNIDLTSSKFINNPSFLIKSGDIIIVNPNLSRVKNAGIIGNSGTLLSLLSFLLSSIIIMNN